MLKLDSWTEITLPKLTPTLFANIDAFSFADLAASSKACPEISFSFSLLKPNLTKSIPLAHASTAASIILPALLTSFAVTFMTFVSV